MDELAVINLFPIAVGRSQYTDPIPSKLIHYMQQLPQRNNSGNTSTINYKILNDKKFKSINNFISKSLQKYFQTIYQPKSKVELYITQSWCNFTNKGQFHHIHHHSNSVISGVFYFQSHESDRIVFHKKEGHEILRLEKEDHNMWNSTTWWLPATVGTLYLFPSTLTHEVPPTESEQTRISLSFNTFLKGIIGKDDDFTLLEL